MNEIAETRPVGLSRAAWPMGAFAAAVTLCVGTVVAVVVVMLTAPVSGEARGLGVPVLVVGGGILLAVGLSDLTRARDHLFGQALLATGLLWALSALAASSNAWLYGIGRVAMWGVDLAFVYLLLAYPSGRLVEQNDRALFRGGALLVGLLYLPTVLLAAHFPVPSTWSNCISSCPANPFAFGHSTPTAISDFLVPAREGLSVALYLAVFFVVSGRGRGAGPLVRRMYAPVVAIALLRTVVLAAYFLTRRTAPGAQVMEGLSSVYVLMLPALATAAVIGRLYPRLFAASALDRIGREMGSVATAAEVGRILGDALEDPALRVFHSFPGDSGEWVDERGSAVKLPQETAERALTEIGSGRWRVTIAHDRALAEDPALVRSAGSYALAELENRRLSGDLSESLRELDESRSRILGAEDRERQKIERDLHDGAQQRLVSVRIRLGLAAERLEGENPGGAATIRELGRDINAAIDEVRSLARGIYPSRLERTGLGGALRDAGRGSVVPTTVVADLPGRYIHEIEATVYFSCSEAMQNAAKHAVGATTISVSVWQDYERLHFEVRDDGAGFDVSNTPLGHGLRNLRDRLTAVGGTTTIQSVPGQGTVVGGSIPVP